MGRPVEFAEVAAAVEQYGPLATLVTVSDDGTPHVGTVLVTAADGRLSAEVGAGTCRNVTARPGVSLAWTRDGLDYQLIVDGTAAVAGDAGADGLQPIAITVTNGILHRLAGRPEAGPTCVAIAVAPAGAEEASHRPPS